jgi:hypothetical protein
LLLVWVLLVLVLPVLVRLLLLLLLPLPHTSSETDGAVVFTFGSRTDSAHLLLISFEVVRGTPCPPFACLPATAVSSAATPRRPPLVLRTHGPQWRPRCWGMVAVGEGVGLWNMQCVAMPSKSTADLLHPCAVGPTCWVRKRT